MGERNIPIPVDQRTKPAGISIACGLALLLRVSLMVMVTFSGETSCTLYQADVSDAREYETGPKPKGKTYRALVMI